MESSPHLYPPSEASGEQSPLPAPRRFTGARAATLAAAAAAAAAPVSESREMIEVAKSSNSSTASVPRRFVRQQVRSPFFFRFRFRPSSRQGEEVDLYKLAGRDEARE